MYIVYGKPGCPFCDKAKALLRNEGVEYIYIGLDERPEDLEWLKSFGCRSVPQIFKMDEEGIRLNAEHHIGGFDHLCEHFEHLKQC